MARIGDDGVYKARAEEGGKLTGCGDLVSGQKWTSGLRISWVLLIITLSYRAEWGIVCHVAVSWLIGG